MFGTTMYTKSHPKVNDYNPLTHTARSSNSVVQASKWESESHFSQSATQGFLTQSQSRFYQSKPQPGVSNQFSGDNKSRDNAARYIQRPQQMPERFDRIAASMRMPVANVAYVNPYTIQKS